MANEVGDPCGAEPRLRGVLRWTLRVLIGAVFVVSAVAKLVAVDEFEIYVYSYGFMPLGMSYVAARLCIGAELVLAVLTLAGVFPRALRMATTALLLLFSLFLCYAFLTGHRESCQCFGQLVSMNPVQSLLKNALLLLLVLAYYSMVTPTPAGRLRSVVAWLLAAAAVAAPFVVSVPDNWYFGPQRMVYGKAALADAIAEGGTLRQMGVGEERRLVAFVTPRCPYCKLARKKIDAIVSRNGIDAGRVVYAVSSEVGDSLFLAITYGSRPLMLLMDGDSVVQTYHLRNIDEEEVAAFLHR